MAQDERLYPQSQWQLVPGIELLEDFEDLSVDTLGRLVGANGLLTQYLPDLDESPPELRALKGIRHDIGPLT